MTVQNTHQDTSFSKEIVEAENEQPRQGTKVLTETEHQNNSMSTERNEMHNCPTGSCRMCF